MRLSTPHHNRTQRGDTLIEVMFAFSIFALIAVGSLTVMNRGIATAQQSLEITLVRAQMDAQAEAIRYLHQAYVAAYQQGGPSPTGTAAEWVKMTNKTSGKGVDAASQFGQTNGSSCAAFTPQQKPFIINARTAKIETTRPLLVAPNGQSLPPFSQVIYKIDSATDLPYVDDAYGIWVEAVPSAVNANGTGFVDFHIRSCWSSIGSKSPVTLGTIVRLYEPR
jgi:type II secretory pathway pseudopilin PulG